MKQINFFKAYTRLGLTNKPYHQKEFNTGVEKGPNAILTKQFLGLFPHATVDSYTFPLPEEVKKDKIIPTLVINWQQFTDLIFKQSKKDNIQIVVGGDHTLTLSGFNAFLKRIGDIKKIGYVHFDTHGDINLYKDSPTKNFHGMYVRAWADTFDIFQVDKLFPKKLPSQNFFFIGNLELDPDEEKFFQKNHFKHLIKKDIVSKPHESLKGFQKFLEAYPYLYVTVDIDVFDKKYAPATGTPPQEGFSFRQLEPFFHAIAKQKDFAFDIAEVNPEKKGSKKTVKLAQHVILTLLGK